MKFRYLNHTADAMFESFGKSLEEAFENAALAAFNILTDVSKVRKEKKFELSLSAGAREKLLFDFLDELLFYLGTEHIIFSGFEHMKISKSGEYKLKCTAFGDHAKNYETHGDVKAPTYNEMKISEDKGRFIIRAVVDI